MVTVLKDDQGRLVMLSALRRSSLLLLLQALAAAVARRGYEVRKALRPSKECPPRR
jgi:hypothetical protein